jgi:hypothetical protein
MQKAGGQPLIGGLDVEVCRNFFGSQVRRGERWQGGTWACPGEELGVAESDIILSLR